MEKMLYSDETKVTNLFDFNLGACVRKPPNSDFAFRHRVKTDEYLSVDINVWGCFSYKGVYPILIKENMTKKMCTTDILRSVMLVA